MTHKHTPASTTGPFPFNGSVAGWGGNRVAHGGIRRVETCRCGHERHVNHNAGQREDGPWGPGPKAEERHAAFGEAWTATISEGYRVEGQAVNKLDGLGRLLHASRSYDEVAVYDGWPSGPIVVGDNHGPWAVRVRS